MKRLLLLIPVLLVSCKTAQFAPSKVQDDEQLVMQLVLFETDYETDDPEQVISDHDSAYEFPSSRLIKDDYTKWDIIADDGHYRMEVSYFIESKFGVDLGIEIQRRIKTDEITYGSEIGGVTKPVYERAHLKTDGLYQKDEWYILGRDYNKPRGEKDGLGVYFLLRVNSRLSYDLDLSKIPEAKLIRSNEQKAE